MPAYADGFKQFGPQYAIPALVLQSFPSWFVGIAFAAIAIGALVLALEDGFRLHRLIDPETTSPDSFFRAIGDLQRTMGISAA